MMLPRSMLTPDSDSDGLFMIGWYHNLSWVSSELGRILLDCEIRFHCLNSKRKVNTVQQTGRNLASWSPFPMYLRDSDPILWRGFPFWLSLKNDVADRLFMFISQRGFLSRVISHRKLRCLPTVAPFFDTQIAGLDGYSIDRHQSMRPRIGLFWAVFPAFSSNLLLFGVFENSPWLFLLLSMVRFLNRTSAVQFSSLLLFPSYLELLYLINSICYRQYAFRPRH